MAVLLLSLIIAHITPYNLFIFGGGGGDIEIGYLVYLYTALLLGLTGCCTSVLWVVNDYQTTAVHILKCSVENTFIR